MTLSDKRWIWCAFSLLCFASFGSCRRHRRDGAPHEPYFFSEVCALKDESGPCKAIKERFFFNINTGRCEVFEYGGCGGNRNNFESLKQCEEACVVSDDKNPCQLPEAPGPCRGLVTRYFFDSKSQQCKHFYYGGCFGNANNFKSMADCQAKCQNPAEPSKTPEIRKSDVVQPTIVTGKPTALKSQVLKLQLNNQEIYDDVCLKPVETGTCYGAEKRFAYNPQTNKCHVFRYSGCGGNENNFLSRRRCFRKCKSGHQLIPIKKKVFSRISHSHRATQY